MSEKKPNMLILAILVIVAVFTVFAGVAQVVETLDVTGFPEPIADILVALKYILIATPVAIGIGFGRNLVGYAIKWMRAKRGEEPEEVNYSMTWMAETIVKFEGFILVVTPFINIFVANLPAEEKTIAMAVTGAFFALFDMVLSEIKHVIKEVKAPKAALPPG